MTTLKKDQQAPASGYEQTKALIEQIGQSRALKPLVNMLQGLLEDPVLKKTLEETPASDGAKHPSDHVN